MRIAIQTPGTRGDVQPYLALSLALLGRGHDVQLAGPAQFAAMAQGLGVPFASLPGEFLALLDTKEGKDAIAGGRGFSAGLKLLDHVRPLMRRLVDEEWAAVRAFQPQVIVHHPKSIASPHMAERLGVPAVLASPVPGFTPTSAFPSPLLPFSSLGPLNKVSHLLATRGADFLFGKMIAEWRHSSLGLARRRAAPRPSATLYAYSSQVLPTPPDFGSDVFVSGYWFLDGGPWQPSEALATFLGAGEPPIYVGFGSMPGLDPQRLAAIVVEGLAMAGRRGLLSTGGGALASTTLASHVFVIADAPHDKILPHVAATVHHGGAGTTAASLRAGLPTTICPFFGDQPFWGRRVAELGVGPPALERKKLTAQALASAVDAMTQPSMTARAAELGAAIRGEDGVGAAIAFLERVVTS